MKSITTTLSKITPNWQVKPVLLFMLLLSLLFMASCGKDDTGTDEPTAEDPVNDELLEEDGISSDDLTTFMGEIGIYLDVRAYVKKGYSIPKVRITPTSSVFLEPLIIEVEKYTNYAVLKLAIVDLSDEAIQALGNGIDIEVGLLDENENVLFTETLEKVIFNNANTGEVLFALDAPDLDIEVYFNPETPYFLQLINESGFIETKTLDNSPNLAYRGTEDVGNTCANNSQQFDYDLRAPTINTNADFANTSTSQQFYLQKLEGENVFSIISADTGTYLASILSFNGTDLQVATSPFTEAEYANQPLPDFLKFHIEKKNGTYQLYAFERAMPLKFSTFERDCEIVQNVKLKYEVTLLSTFGSEKGQNFRIVASNVNYEGQTISTEYMQPILPPAENSFGFNSTLKNCTSNDIQQEIGVQIDESTTMFVSWEDTVGFAQANGEKTTISVEAEASAEFFGVGASVSGSSTEEIELTTSYTAEATTAGGQEDIKTKSFNTKRTLTVSPGKQILAYDAIQTYPNIKIPFVQRISLKGRNSNGQPLTGVELATQATFGGFTGVITEIGATFIEITIRGTARFDQSVEIVNESFESDADCN